MQFDLGQTLWALINIFLIIFIIYIIYNVYKNIKYNCRQNENISKQLNTIIEDNKKIIENLSQKSEIK